MALTLGANACDDEAAPPVPDAATVDAARPDAMVISIADATAATEPDAPVASGSPQCWGLPHADAQGRYMAELADPTIFVDNGTYDRAIELVRGTDELGEFFLLAHQGGAITRFRANTPPELVLDLSEQVWLEHKETGVVSIALHPGFPEVPDLFVVFATPGEPLKFISRVARFALTTEGVFDPESMRVVLDLPQPHGSHSVNHVAFGPDGYLYVSAGDGQNPGDPFRNGQNNATLYGTLMRLDVSDADGGYVAPPDNPFAGGPGDAPAVFAYGLRNPWRFSIDATTGEIWAGDVGESAFEEIDRIEPGANYGWPILEGQFCHGADLCADEALVAPAFHYPHSEGQSVVGGRVYHGTTMPELEGAYVFGDYVTGTIRALWPQGDGSRVETLVETHFNIASFAQTADNELYVVRYSKDRHGGVYLLRPRTDVATPPPVMLSMTGCFDDVATQKPATRVVPYTINSPLWSDGSDKQRWLALPPGEKIDVLPDGDFDFPIGTTLIKSFAYDERVHETRLMVNTDQGWSGFTYEWLPDGSDAMLLESGKDVVLPGGQPWHYPSRAQCFRCHNEAANYTLGPEVGQLPAQGPNSLRTWHGRGMFVPRFLTAQDIPAHPRVYPTPAHEGDAGARARSYLHANCSFCHRPAGPGRGNMDLRFDTPMVETGLCDELPQHGFLYTGNTNLRLLAPADPGNSIIWLRMATVNRFRMPALASTQVDQLGIQLIGQWIHSRAGCPEL